MNSATPALTTVEEMYGLPEDGRHYELVQGRLVSEPPTGFRHGRITTAIIERLGPFVRAHRLGVVLASDPGFVLHRGPDTLRAPDVAFVSSAKMATLDDERLFFPGAPDLAIEVLSPGDRPASVHAKVADYLAAGTHLVWVVDPEQCAVRCYRELLEPRVLTESDELVAEDLLPGFRLAVAQIFES